MAWGHVRGGSRLKYTIDSSDEDHEEHFPFKSTKIHPTCVQEEPAPHLPTMRPQPTSQTPRSDSASDIFEDARERLPNSGADPQHGLSKPLRDHDKVPLAKKVGALSVGDLSESDRSETPCPMGWSTGAPEGSCGSETPISVRSGIEHLPIRSKSPQTFEKPDYLFDTDSEISSTLIDESPSSSLSVEIPNSTLLAPRSSYEPFNPGMEIASESIAVDNLLTLLNTEGDFHELQLNDFAIYNDRENFGVEMRPLHQLDTRPSGSPFLFSGVLSAAGVAQTYFVKDVPIAALPIGNYTELEAHSVQGDIWIQSLANERTETYYKLGKPALEYRRFFEPFVWAADLAKHFVDYVQSMSRAGHKVSIHHFRSDFSQWMQKVHGHSPLFNQWLSKHTGSDFRASVVANLPFLYKEANGILKGTELLEHPVWAEIRTFKRYPAPPKKGRGKKAPPTIVTPYIFDCFTDLPCGNLLKEIPFSAETGHLRDSIIQHRLLELPRHPQADSRDPHITAEERIRRIKPGDTISTKRDAADTGTKWQDEKVKGDKFADRWFALVQEVKYHPTKGKCFNVIWYYRPADTLCGLMKYPWNNELFLSDHCSCGETHKIQETEVIEVHDVVFGGFAASSDDLFCRQLYMHEERKWVTLEFKHRWCEHVRLRPGTPDYRQGDTILVRLDKMSGFCEPFEIISCDKIGRRSCFKYTVRRLLRRREVDQNAPDAPVNELVYPASATLQDHELEDNGIVVKAKENAFIDRCVVRCFNDSEPIPTPYNRHGVGALFYITHQQMPNGSIIPLDDPPPSLKQGFDPCIDLPRLRGLDLFCGGGNFGRGLEDGGGVQMRWANDYDAKAIHTYMANVDPQKEEIHPFAGSIDILQRQAIEGRFSKAVPRIGEVDLISAGSPCPGFSNLTNDKTTDSQRKNQSLVASFASFVDLYRPRYGLLENVPGIVQKKSNRDQDVFSQLICALVGIGYQTQVYFLDAYSCGSPQLRSRIFVVFAAPGCRLPRQPTHTHSHPPGTKALSLGRLPTDEPMARRQFAEATPFKFVTAEEATKDLPWIGDSKADACVSHPDHRLAIGITKKKRVRIQLIPTTPFGMNFSTAWYGTRHVPGAKIEYIEGKSVMTKAERKLFKDSKGDTTSLSTVAPKSNAYGRVWPDRPFGAIVTRCDPNDAKAGRHLHWQEDRVLSIMEARRAQGFRDDEVILGLPSDQFRIVGNSVAREVSVALGLVLREAWEGTVRDQRISGESPDMVDTRVQEGDSPGLGDHDTIVVSQALVTDESSDDEDRALMGSSGDTPMSSNSELDVEKRYTSKRPNTWTSDQPSKVSRTRASRRVDTRVKRTRMTTTEVITTSTTVQTEQSTSVATTSSRTASTVFRGKKVEAIVLD